MVYRTAAYALVLMAMPAAVHAQSGLSVLNQQSYSEEGEEWSVMFEAPAGQLSISGAGGTQVGSDVSFARLGGLAPSTSGGTMTFAWGGGSGELVVSVLEPGMHEILFESAGVQARAYNDAYPSTAKMIGGAAGGPGVLAGDQFGTSVANIGDVDGDGTSDIAAGFPFRSNNAGAAYVILMNGDGTAKASSELLVSGVAAGDQFGNAVAGIGDVDGDGIPDIAVGSPKKSQGQVLVITLNADGTAKSLGAAISAPLSARSGAEFGASVAGIGDVDGDGIPDIAVGSPNARSVTGAVHAVLLRADGSARQTVEVRAGSNQLFGSSVSGIGDFDRDGVPDLVVGSPGNARNTGAVHVVRLNADGSVKGTSSIDGAPFGAGLRFGTSVSGVGDLDGDGIPDIVAGVPQASPGGNGRGAAHVIYLAASGGIKSSYQIDGTSPHMPSMANFDLFGRAVAGLGDLDRDGSFELAVGAPGDDDASLDAGALYVIRLDRAAPAGSGELREIARVGSDHVRLSLPGIDEFGYSAAAIGDVNGDGVPDIAVGARSNDTSGSARGIVYVLMMAADGRIDELTQIASGTGGGPTLSNGDRFGSGVAGLGDIDGDGIPDIAVGAGYDDRTYPDEGSVYLLLLNRDGTAKSHSKIDGSTANGPTLTRDNHFGDSISSADLDSDGTADLAVGAPAFVGRNTGAVHVFLMNSDRTIKSSSVIDGRSVTLSSNDLFGRSVSFVGDLDGDGVPDLAAGSPWDDNGGRNRGAVHVFLMNSDGTVKTAREINSGTARGPALGNGDWFGSGVSSVGDVDGDGVPDIVAGAVGDDGSGRNTGVLHFLYMNSDATLKGSSEVPSSSAGSETASDFGWSIAPADIDGDGLTDLTVGAPGTDSDTGEAYVLLMSGTSVSTSVALSESEPDLPSTASNMLGGAVAGIGDLDRDGVPDVAVGVGEDDTRGIDKGGVYVAFMNRDGSVKGYASINDATPGITLQLGGKFGSAVAGIGDLDRDGVPDIAAGAPLSGSLSHGQLRIMQMNADGTVARNTVAGDGSTGITLGGGDMFGSAVAGIGDMDGNGVPDIAVGAPLADSTIQSDTNPNENLGAVMFMLMDYGQSGPSWSVVRVPGDYDVALEGGDMLGSAVAGIGDIDGNGVSDVAVGAPGDDGRGSDAQRGAVHVLLMSRTGVHSTVRIGDGIGGGPSMSGDYLFGSSVSGIGDLDRDGVPDIAVGAPGVSSDEGAGWVLFMNADGSARQAVQVGGAPGLSAGDMFGSSVSLLGDLNGDGAVEIAVGAPGHDDEGDDDKGTVRVMSGFRPAVVTGVDSSAPDGAYGIGDGVDIAVEFSGPVSVTGAPRLLLETGRSDGRAEYSSGSGTDELSFEYTVREGDVSADLGYVSISSLSASGGQVAWSGRAASLDLPRPGVRDSLSFSKQLAVDGVRPVIAGPVVLDLSLGTLAIEFSEDVDVSEIDAGGISVHAGGSRTSLAGAILPDEDAAALAIRLTGEQTREIVGAYLAAAPLRMDVAGSVVSDLVGNYFVGTADTDVSASLTLAVDAPPFSDSARSYKSGHPASDRPPASDSASSLAYYVRVASDAPPFSDSAHSYKSSSVLHDSPASSDSASALMHYARDTLDSPPLSDSARSYQSGSTSADSPSASDSAAAYKSGIVASDSPLLLDSVTHARASVRTSSDTAAVSDSARSHKSGFLGTDSPLSSDSALTERALTRSSSDTAAFSDSAYLYKSGAALSDSPALSDSASYARLLVQGSSDTAVFSDSAGAYRSAVHASDAPALSDSAQHGKMSVQGSSDTAVFSDSARAYKSARLVSDSPAVSDSVSSSGMLVEGLSDIASVSDSARSHKSGVFGSDSPALTDSASYTGMLVQGSSDTAVFSDSARAHKSALVSSDAPALTDSASYTGMLVQGISDVPSVSDSARSYKSGTLLSDSPSLSDSTAGLGSLTSSSLDAAAVSDSARAYKSGLVQQSLPALSDQLRWGSVRVAGVQDSPVSSDSVRVYRSSVTTGDAPVHNSEARASKTATIEYDAPLFSDASFIGRPPAVTGDLPDVRDGVSFHVGEFELDGDLDMDARAPDLPPDYPGLDDLPPDYPGLDDLPPDYPGLDDLPPDYPGLDDMSSDQASSGDEPLAGGSGAPEPPRRGSGSVGAVTVSVHGASWDMCSQDPHVLVVAGPDCGNVAVTISQQGGFFTARQTGATGAPPDSCVWRAPVNPDVQEVQIRAAHGRAATSDERTLVMDSCSGWAPFTPFAVRAGPPMQDSELAPAEPDLLPASEDSRVVELDPKSQGTMEDSEAVAPTLAPLADAKNSPETLSSLVQEPATVRTVPPTEQPVLDVEPTGVSAAPAILPEREPDVLVWAIVAAALAIVIGLVVFRARRAARS